MSETEVLALVGLVVLLILGLSFVYLLMCFCRRLWRRLTR